MTISENITKKRLKIKFSSKKVEAEPGKETCELGHQILVNNGGKDSVGTYGDWKYEMNSLGKSVVPTFHEQKLYASDSLMVKLPILGAKREHSGLNFQKEKRLKVDRCLRQQCSGILKSLMNHRYGWVFNQPVDPVALGIPDYFSIISNPMDLGTIKKKLQADLYSNVDEFAADIRLTFSNAMLYNPPSTKVHCIAKDLSNIFSRRWKLLEAKCNSENTIVEQQSTLNGCVKSLQEVMHNDNEKSLSHVNLLPRSPMSSKEKLKLKKQLVQVSRGKMTEKLQIFLEKFDVISKEEIFEVVDIDAFDEETLLELKRLMKDSLDLSAAKIQPTKAASNGRRSLVGKNLKKGTHSGSRDACASANFRRPLSLTASICGSCGTLKCQCRLQNDSEQTSSSDMSSERSSLRDQQCAYKKDCEVEATLASHIIEDVNVLDKENLCASPQISTSCTTAAPGEVWTPLFDVELSPKKALRAAMLKSRFADTIFKARQKTLLDHDDKPDVAKIQQEKERLERQQREEKGRIEAQIRVAEALSRRKAEAELKMQREREREAARIALQKMEKTVEMSENLQSLKDLEELLTGSLSDYRLATGVEGSEVVMQAFGGCNSRKLLEQLGLFIKEDYCTEMEYEDGKGEEGEIVC